MKFKSIIFSVIALITMFISCRKGFLDVSDNLAGQLTMEKIFSDATLTRQWFANIFNNMPDYSNMLLGSNGANVGGLGDPWPTVSDELKGGQGPARNLTQNGYNADNAPFQRWSLCYTSIRQANIFLANAKAIPQQGNGSADFIEAAEMNKMKAQARFMRAYYYYLLFELYGPVPIDTTVENPTNPNLDFARNSVDEVVRFISGELDAVANQLDVMPVDDNHRAMPTKGVALALKAKLLIYAASPLFNGGNSEALAIKNNDGKEIFPAADPNKWKVALNALQGFIDFANAGHYQLYKLYNKDGSYNPDSTLYELFIVYNNPEIIWGSSVSSWGTLSGEGIDRRCTPRSEYGGFENISVDQSLVDAFFMNDGLPISQSSEYKISGFSAPGDDTTGRTEPGTFNQWVNREPRFYQTVFYQGRRWHLSNHVIQFEKGSPNDNSSGNYPWSGYTLYKRISREILNTGSYPRSQYRPSIIFRLAEFYLLYAEALNEVNPGDPRIIEYVDKVRDRAGIPLLKNIQPQIIGDQNAQREAIRREMRVELCTEGQRYFNVRRWMIADKQGSKQGGVFYGMNMNGAGNSFYQVTPYETRVWNKEMYLYPIPLAEIQKSRLLKQNPGW